MKTRKITIQEFVDLCKNKGIHIVGIDGNNVILLTPNLSNICTEHSDIIIDRTWKDSLNSLITLEDSIRNNQCIMAIKIIRNNTRLGLKESKDIYDANWENWKKELGVIPQDPPRDI